MRSIPNSGDTETALCLAKPQEVAKAAVGTYLES